MVLTRSVSENKSKDELINELVRLSSFRSELEELKKQFIDFNTNYSRIYSELEVSKNCSSLLRERIIQLERNTLNISQYLRREMIELNPVPNDIDDNLLEEHVCKALSLVSSHVIPNNLQACHRMKRKDRVIVIFSNRKLQHKILLNKKNLKNKSQELTNLKFSGKLFVSESLCKENHALFYKCRQLKTAHKIHSTWFANGPINIKLNDNSRPKKIHHCTDIEKLLEIDNLDEFLNNTSY